MDNATYATLTRQSGLLAEMQVVANNIANASTTGYRSESVIFSEHIKALGPDASSLSMANAAARDMSGAQGTLERTGGGFDLAIEGDGYFLIDTPQGQRLTRAGHFLPGPEGGLLTPDGFAVLDAGGAPVFVPPGVGAVAVAPDGTLSAGGAPIGQIGVFLPLDPLSMTREGGVRFAAEGGVEPVPGSRVVQGFLESSNVNPIMEVSRMIEVQRAYELGQNFLDKEDERIRSAIRTLGRQ